MKATLDHIGIAVVNLGEALSFYRDALGLDVEPRKNTREQGTVEPRKNTDEHGTGEPRKNTDEHGTGEPRKNTDEHGTVGPRKNTDEHGTGEPRKNTDEHGTGEEVLSQRVRVHFIPVGQAALELLEATDDSSPIAKYIAKRGPGLHHITLRVDDLRSALAQLKDRGVRLIDESPRPGAHGSLVAFIHPSSAHGVLVELKQVIEIHGNTEADET